MSKLTIPLVLGLAVSLATLIGQPAASASSGNAIAEYNRGQYDTAYVMMKESAEAGDVNAHFYLGLMSHQGRGTPINYRQAIEWYRLAADAGDARSRNNLGVMYRDGLGAVANEVLAYMWFSLAAGSQSSEAKRNLQELVRILERGDILQGQQLTEEYLERLERSHVKSAANNSSGASGTTIGPVAAKEPVKLIVLAEADDLAQVVATPKKEVVVQAAAPAPSGPAKQLDNLKTAKVAPAPVPSAPAAPAKQVAAKPIIVASAPEATRPVPAAAPVVVSKPRTVKASPPTPEKVQSAREYVVQLGLFSKISNVQNIEKKLEKHGMALLQQQVQVRTKKYHRLRVGPFASIKEARQKAKFMDRMFRIKSRVFTIDG
jgi:hypothetical protein